MCTWRAIVRHRLALRSSVRVREHEPCGSVPSSRVSHRSLLPHSSGVTPTASRDGSHDTRPDPSTTGGGPLSRVVTEGPRTRHGPLPLSFPCRFPPSQAHSAGRDPTESRSHTLHRESDRSWQGPAVPRLHWTVQPTVVYHETAHEPLGQTMTKTMRYVIKINKVRFFVLGVGGFRTPGRHRGRLGSEGSGPLGVIEVDAVSVSGRTCPGPVKSEGRGSVPPVDLLSSSFADTETHHPSGEGSVGVH